MAARVLIMAGGTGGHIFPALTVAERLRAQGLDVQWLGTRAGLEAELVPRAGFPISFIAVSGLRGKSVLSWVLAPYKLALAFLQTLALMWRLKPALVLGMGGFVTGPGGFVAWLLDRPLVIHEQNSIAGLTNRLLAPLANRVLEAFPGSLPEKYQPLHTGNPVRAAITALATHPRTAHDGPLRLLVLGGSRGARALNEAVPRALREIDAAERPEVWHQTGAQHFAAAEQAYRDAHVTVGPGGRIAPFIDDMAEAYTWADLVLCRAGALTLAELACAGVASILVPYPFAVDDHQTRNARYLADAQAALLVPQPQLTPQHLATLLAQLQRAPERLRAMGAAARRLALPDAAARVADLCREVAHV